MRSSVISPADGWSSKPTAQSTSARSSPSRRRNSLKPVIVGGAEAWVVASDLAKAKVPVILDPLVNLPASFDRIGARLDNAALLNRAGVKVAFTLMEDPTQRARRIRQVAGNAVAHGLPPDVALAAITATPAEIFGLGASRGRIAAGQVADLVLWTGDPLEVTTVAEQVWIAGASVEMKSRQTELRDRYVAEAAEQSGEMRELSARRAARLLPAR